MPKSRGYRRRGYKVAKRPSDGHIIIQSGWGLDGISKELALDELRYKLVWEIDYHRRSDKVSLRTPPLGRIP